jgi:hypothetical protein
MVWWCEAVVWAGDRVRLDAGAMDSHARWFALIGAVVAVVAAGGASPTLNGVPCPVNHSLFPPMSCPSGTQCRPAPDPNR